MNIRRILFLIALIALGFAAQPAQAQSDDADEKPDCYRYYEYVGGARDAILTAKNIAVQFGMDETGAWNNLETIDFEQRQRVVAQGWGIASFSFIDNVIAMTGNPIGNADGRADRPLVQGFVDYEIARAAICDDMFGFEDALTPMNDRATEVLRLAKQGRSVSGMETIQCDWAYEAGQKNWTVKKQPIAALWDGAPETDFHARGYNLDMRADIVSAGGRTNNDHILIPKEEKWETRLPAAIEAEDVTTQMEFWADIAECDAKFAMGDGRFGAEPPVTAGPLVEPRVAHLDCAANYAALGQVYSSNPQAKGYFDQRGLNAARYVNLFGDYATDQEVITRVNESALERLNTYQKPDGTVHATKIMQTFEESLVCDQQYGLPLTTIPEDLRRQARMDR